MPHIAIISSRVRTGRQSHQVALYFKNYLESNGLASAEVLDLAEYGFPLFEEQTRCISTVSAGGFGGQKGGDFHRRTIVVRRGCQTDQRCPDEQMTN